MMKNTLWICAEVMSQSKLNNLSINFLRIHNLIGDGLIIQGIILFVFFISMLDMIAANNLHELFDYIIPVMVKRCPKEQVFQILNKQNYNRSTPLHYAVVTESKDMVRKLLEAGADPQLANQSNRTPLQEAEKFQKYQIAEILAPVTKTDLEALRKQVGDIKLNDDSSDEQEQLPTIQQKQEKQEEKQQQQEYKKQEVSKTEEKGQ